MLGETGSHGAGAGRATGHQAGPRVPRQAPWPGSNVGCTPIAEWYNQKLVELAPMSASSPRSARLYAHIICVSPPFSMSTEGCEAARDTARPATHLPPSRWPGPHRFAWAEAVWALCALRRCGPAWARALQRRPRPLSPRPAAPPGRPAGSCCAASTRKPAPQAGLGCRRTGRPSPHIAFPAGPGWALARSQVSAGL